MDYGAEGRIVLRNKEGTLRLEHYPGYQSWDGIGSTRYRPSVLYLRDMVRKEHEEIWEGRLRKADRELVLAKLHAVFNTGAITERDIRFNDTTIVDVIP